MFVRFPAMLLTITVLFKLESVDSVNEGFRVGFGVEESEQYKLGCLCSMEYKTGYQYYCGHELTPTAFCKSEAVYICTKFNDTKNANRMFGGQFKKKCAKKCKPVDCSKSNVKDCEQHQLRECE
jgi:hypothetical protein